MNITFSQLLQGIAMLERIGMSVAQVRAMQKAGISDEQMQTIYDDLERVHDAHQALDLRKGDPV